MSAVDTPQIVGTVGRHQIAVAYARRADRWIAYEIDGPTITTADTKSEAVDAAQTRLAELNAAYTAHGPVAG